MVLYRMKSTVLTPWTAESEEGMDMYSLRNGKLSLTANLRPVLYGVHIDQAHPEEQLFFDLLF